MRDPSLEMENPTPFLKVVLFLPWGSPSTTLGAILCANTLFGSVTHGEDTWLIDSGASKHMTGKKQTLPRLEEKNSPQKVSLGNYYQYPIKGIGESRYNLDSGNSMKMKESMYVPG